MDNNMSEGLNTWISEARDKPIVTLVDTIRRQLMVRYMARIDYSSKFKGKLCLSIAKNIERKKVNARGLQVIYSGGTVFEVTSADKVYVVNIGEHSCTCRRWDLNGIPCIHGCAAIISHKAQPEDYVNDCYSTETFIRTYTVGRGRGKGIGTDTSGNGASAGRGRGRGLGSDESGSVAGVGMRNEPEFQEETIMIQLVSDKPQFVTNTVTLEDLLFEALVVLDQGSEVIAEGLDTLENMANDLNEVHRATSDLKNANVRLKDMVTKHCDVSAET
ncbi:hypothetical protein RHSIM_Rhsim10G0192300 [Rhododendron simsii]|uniref:SWIM-type domain-containing protein n=1 Tax=Rhododendron simsii TaxID=118357 RepID=A0A834LCY2_RHOSS|nr:hypothetical protein RHSIM_Rhsim10G0192300 [Rhododendron simsii]